MCIGIITFVACVARDQCARIFSSEAKNVIRNKVSKDWLKSFNKMIATEDFQE